MPVWPRPLDLDPEDWQTRADLAILWEHNPQGIRYGGGAKLEEAIAEYKKLVKETEGTNLAENLPFALIWAHRFSEARDAVKNLPASSVNRAILLLTAIAAAEGPQAAIREANFLGLDAQARQQALENAGGQLTKVRLYSQSGALLAAAAQGSQNAAALLARANLITKLKRHEDSLLPADDPRSVVQKMFMLLALDNVDLLPRLAMMTSRHGQRKLLRREEIEKTSKELRSVRASVAKLQLPADVLLDLMFGTVRFTMEGDKSVGFRVQGQIFGGAQNLTLLVTLEDGQYSILDDGENPELAGREIWERAERGDLAGALQLLDWRRR